MFPTRRKNRLKKGITKNCYIISENLFEFGPLLINKTEEDKNI